jgi:hypothetical protein
MEETIYKEIKEESGYQNIEVKKQIIDHLHFL